MKLMMMSQLHSSIKWVCELQTNTKYYKNSLSSACWYVWVVRNLRKLYRISLSYQVPSREPELCGEYCSVWALIGHCLGLWNWPDDNDGVGYIEDSLSTTTSGVVVGMSVVVVIASGG